VDADGLLDRLVTTVAGLGLTWEGTALPVGKRKVDVSQDQLNDPPQVVLSKSARPERVQRWASTGHDRHTYYFRASLIAAGRQDMTANHPDHAAFRKTLIATFAKKAGAGLDDVTGLQDVRSRPDDWLPRDRIDDGYDTQAVEIEISVVEERGEP
jgi:hypothetical protein